MGRRSINTTKSGKYMNPTDQARKEARKKELKKNKKQRQMVRAAVLKGKDPQQLIVDLEKIDQMEYNVLQPSPLNEKVLKDKRKKLKDTLDRVMKMYNKDDPEKWAELKRVQVDYERKRSTLFNYYESVKNAQQVQVDDIPLPISSLPPELQAAYVGMPSQIPLPSLAPPLINIMRPPQFPPPVGILKKNSVYSGKELKREPPGVPPGPPPDLEEMVEEEPIPEILPVPQIVEEPVVSRKSIRFADESEAMAVDKALEEAEKEQEEFVEEDMDEFQEPIEDREEEPDEVAPPLKEDPGPRPSSLQQKMLALAGQDIDQFMKEMEVQHKKRRADRAAELETRLQALGPNDKVQEIEKPVPQIPSLLAADLIPPGTDNHPFPNIPPVMGILGPPPLMFRPPALMGIRLPPGPPPGLPPRLGMRMPPGPPPGLPPRLMRPPTMTPMPQPAAPPPIQQNVLTAAPQLISRPADPAMGPTIQAQAQIRNLSADVTRFLPTALRVKRDDKNKMRQKPLTMQEAKVEILQPTAKPGQTKDDAYQQFMREMEGLL